MPPRAAVALYPCSLSFGEPGTSQLRMHVQDFPSKSRNLHSFSNFQIRATSIVANYPGLTGRLPVFLAFPGLPPVYSIAIEFPGFFLELLHKPT